MFPSTTQRHFASASLCFLAACGMPDPAPQASWESDVDIHIAASTATFPHSDAYAGQTARGVRGGIRSLSLLRTSNDANPLVLFNHGAKPVEVGYNDGDDTVVATIPASTLRAGHYTLARMVQTHSRFQVDACAHGASSVDGTVDDVIVMSSGTMLDGAMRNAGFYQFAFSGGDVVQERTGDDWPVPVYSTTAGAWASVEDGEWAVYFPVNLDVDLDLPAPSLLSVVVNMDRAFRWMDSTDVATNAPGVWDVADGSHEPVMQFGGNRFDVTLR